MVLRSSRRRCQGSAGPVDGNVDVYILRGANIPKKGGFLPRYTTSWEVYAFNEVDGYLREKIDFFVSFHIKDWVEAFGMAILEAMSYGVVCVLPERFRPVFQDAAVYTNREDVRSVMISLWDSERYAEQERRATECVERECTPQAYLRRLSDLPENVRISAGREGFTSEVCPMDAL